MRITAGQFKGRKLAAPSGIDTRPTSDRVRQAIFNTLQHGAAGLAFDGMQVLDLFAGTGALGLEALSRGAAGCTFVDTGTPARATLRANIESFGVAGVTKVLRRNATDLGQAARIPPANLVFLDPPYGHNLAQQALTSALAGDWLTPDAVAVIEEASTSPPKLPASFMALDEKRYGDTTVTFAQRTKIER